MILQRTTDQRTNHGKPWMVNGLPRLPASCWNEFPALPPPAGLGRGRSRRIE
jgi:hypothetical protein